MAYKHIETRVTNYMFGGTYPIDEGPDFRGFIKTYYDQTADDIANNRSRIKIDIGAISVNGTQPSTTFRVIGKIEGVTRADITKTRSITSSYTVDDSATDILVSHDSNGVGDVTIYLSIAYSATRILTYTYTLPTISRYAAITTFNGSASNPNAIAVNWAADKTCSAVKYSLNGGSSWSSSVGSGTSGTFNITGLSASTGYSILLKVTATDSGLDTTSSSPISVTTHKLCSITSAISFNIGTDIPVTIDRQDTSYTTNIVLQARRLATDSWTTIKSVTGIGASGTISLTESERNALYALIPDKNSAFIQTIATTIKSGTSYGTATNSGMATVVNSNPVFLDFAFEDTNATTLAITGDSSKFIKGYSNAQMTVSTANKAIAQNGASMSTYSFENAGLTTPTPKAYSAVASVVETLNGVLNANLVVRATDSRGNNTTKTKTIGTFVEYTVPTVSAKNIYRDNNVESTVVLSFSGTYNNWSGLSQDNTILNAKYRYRESGGSWSGYTNITLTTNASGAYTYSGAINGDLGASGFDTTKSFEVEITVTDRLASLTPFTVTLNSAQPLFWKFKGLVSGVLKSILGIGKKPDTTLPTGSIDVAGDIKVAGNINGITPTELATLDGITSSTTELNVLDGIPATLTATELGYVDGVTSAIQTQLDNKINGWMDVTISGTMTDGTITTQIGGVNIDLRNYKMVNVRFRAIGNSAHSLPAVLRFNGSNNYLLFQYGNLIHYVTIHSIVNGSFVLAISAFGGATVTIQLASISVATWVG